jgi:hypothetical protein
VNGLQSATTCSSWFLARGFFNPEDEGDKFLRNIGSDKIYTAPHPRRRHSSKKEGNKEEKGGKQNMRYWSPKVGLPIPVLQMIIKPYWGEFMSTQILRNDMIVF